MFTMSVKEPTKILQHLQLKHREIGQLSGLEINQTKTELFPILLSSKTKEQPKKKIDA